MKSWGCWVFVLMAQQAICDENFQIMHRLGELPSYFLWSYGISSQAHVAPFQDLLYFMTRSDETVKGHIFYPPYTNIESGQLVWLHPIMLSSFVESILPTLQVPVFLIVNNDDSAFPSVLSYEERTSLMESKNILHIFAQNCDFLGEQEKVTQIPIGIDYHTKINYGESAYDQEIEFLQIVQTLSPTHQRLPRIFADFQHHDTSGQRKAIFNRIEQSGLVDATPEAIPRDDLWRKKGEYAFSVSPHGHGLDCHRTWEDLILGCIVIVKTSTLDPLYEGLPVVIVQDWDEITSENLQLWLEQYGDAFTNPDYRKKLTNVYWLEKIRRIMKAKWNP